MSKKLIISIIVLVIVLGAGAYLLANPNLKFSWSNSKASYDGGEFAGSNDGPAPREFQSYANEYKAQNPGSFVMWEYIGEGVGTPEDEDCSYRARDDHGTCHSEWWGDVYKHWLYTYVKGGGGDAVE